MVLTGVGVKSTWRERAAFGRRHVRAGRLTSRFLAAGDPAKGAAAIGVWQSLVSDPLFKILSPDYQAQIFVDAGIAFRFLAELESSADLLDVAIGLHQAAVRVAQEAEVRATAHIDLAIDYLFSFRAAGEFSQLQEAANSTSRAVDAAGEFFHSDSGSRVDVAQLRNFAKVYYNAGTIVAEAAKNIDSHKWQYLAYAISYFEAADEMYRSLHVLPTKVLRSAFRSVYEQDSAPVHGALGMCVFLRQGMTGDPAELDRAIDLLDRAAVHAFESEARAHFLAQLGECLLARHELSARDDDLADALSATGMALELSSAKGANPKAHIVCAYADALGRAELNNSDSVRGGSEARTAYGKAALRALDTEPLYFLSVARQWGGFESRRGAWGEAAEVYANAVATMGSLGKRNLSPEFRDLLVRHGDHLYTDQAYALARLDRLDEAVLTIERGTATWLAEFVTVDEATMESLLEAADPALVEGYLTSAQSVRSLIAQHLETLITEPGAASPSAKSTLASLADARSRNDDALRRLQETSGVAAPQDVSMSDLFAAADQFPLVYLLPGDAGGLALIVRSDRTISPVWLPDLSRGSLGARVQAYFDSYLSRKESGASFERWGESLLDLLEWLWESTMGPVLSCLRSEKAAVVPCGHLSLLPLHAAVDGAAGESDPSFVLQSTELTYTPNARMLVAARARRRQATRALVVNNPQPTSFPPLEHSDLEVAQLTPLFSENVVLRHDQATRTAILERLPSCEVFHFSGHGFAQAHVPNQTGLLVANDEYIRVFDIASLALPKLRLATLSACETSLMLGGASNEAEALPAAFLHAGAAGVLGTLWAVDEVGSGRIVGRFYELWLRESIPPATALRMAQLELLDSAGDDDEAFLSHPAFWAPFVFFGN